MEINELLQNNSYPGRGILIGQTTKREAVIAYFIMGRSENSRNRIFEKTSDGIKTQAFDPSKLSDPSLVIYTPVRIFGNTTIVTNGDQTDTIYDYVSTGKTFEDALSTRKYEPDAPNFTPRISGVVDISDKKQSYKLSILKSNPQDSNSCVRFFYDFSEPVAGYGHFIHTYKCDGNPIPSFEGEPVAVKITGTAKEFANTIWNSLNDDNKVSLFVRYIPLDGGLSETIIINKNM